MKIKKKILKNLIRLAQKNHNNYYFSHEDVRSLAQDAREKYGLTIMRGQDPQKLVYLALAAATAAVVRESSCLDEKINMKSSLTSSEEIKNFYHHLQKINFLHNLEV